MTRHRGLLLGVVLVVLVIGMAGVALSVGVADTTAEIVGSIRAPRVVMAILVGAGLAVAGALLQGSLANPLADPALVGVSSSAALGAVLAVALGASYNSLLTALAASIAAALALVIVGMVAWRDRQPEVVTLLLAGVAVTAFTIAAVSVLGSTGSPAAARPTSFWSSGSLALSTWDGVIAVAPFVIVGLGLAATTTRALDVMSLGDRAAELAGVPVSAVRYRSLLAVVLLVAAGVSVVGVIAFVGLLVPHAIRMVSGPRHGPLLVLSALGGALLILVADTLARIVANPVEIPLGAITAVLGAPLFFVLVRRTRSRQGGWA